MSLTTRLAFLLLLPLLSCASAERARRAEREQWRGIQRQRLATLLPAPPEARRPAVVASPPAAQDPTPRPFAPRHRRQVEVRVGGGSYAVRMPGTQFDDRTQVVAAELGIAPLPPSGYGLVLGGFATADDLFADRTINNGAQPVRAEARALGLQVFPYHQWSLFSAPGVAVPLRAGAFLDWTALDHSEGDIERSWFGFGPRVQVEPEWKFMHREGQTLSLFGQVGAEWGGSWFREDYANGSDRDFTDRWGGHAGGGLRAKWDAMAGEIGYRFGYRDLGDPHTDLLGDVGKVEERTHLLFVGMSVRF